MTHEIQVDQLIRTKRRTIAIEIRKDASLVVRAPQNASEKAIQEILFKKRFWIQKHQEDIRTKKNCCQPQTFQSGDSCVFLGEVYPLRWVEEAAEPLRLADGAFHLVGRCHPHARELFKDWYKDQAVLKISERVEWFSSRAGIGYEEIHITDAASRWGSCSSWGSLNFSWRIMLAPLAVVDYVVVHELAHLRELNHSHRFWSLVKYLLPGFETQEQWLKDYGHTLDL